MNMTQIPIKQALIKDATTHLRNTLNKGPNNRAPEGLKKLIPRLVSYWFSMQAKGFDFIYPGRSQMARWAGVTQTTIKRYLNELRGCRVIIVTNHANGGRGKATEFRLNTIALKQWLVTNQFNPSRQLISKLNDLDRSLQRGPERGPQ